MSPEATISKSKKVIAATKATFIVLVVLSFFMTSAATLIILNNQQAAADRLLDCIVPSGACYQVKSQELNIQQEVYIGTVIEYCGTVDDSSVAAISKCVQQELRKR